MEPENPMTSPDITPDDLARFAERVRICQMTHTPDQTCDCVMCVVAPKLLTTLDRLLARVTEVEGERDDAVKEGLRLTLQGDALREVAANTEDALIERVQALEGERDAFRRVIDAEMEGKRELRDELGAREDETFSDFVRRLSKERDAFKFAGEQAMGMGTGQAILDERDRLKMRVRELEGEQDALEHTVTQSDVAHARTRKERDALQVHLAQYKCEPHP